MEAVMTSLSYSGGEQSHGILEMVLRGDIERPKNFVVIGANPGMEDERSQEFVENARLRCREAEIPFVTTDERNLYLDLIMLPFTGETRMDNPPYWVKKPNGKIGRLKQKCTGAYKIAPLNRARRLLMHEICGISPVTKHLPRVDVWIGFAADEASRVSEKKTAKGPKYLNLRYILIEKGITRAKMAGYYLKHNIPKPPRSVCCACFSNGLKYFRDMYNYRPRDWEKAVLVDESVRDLRQIGIKGEVFVSSTCIPLKDLPALNFLDTSATFGKFIEHECNSGVCYL